MFFFQNNFHDRILYYNSKNCNLYTDIQNGQKDKQYSQTKKVLLKTNTKQ